MDDVTTLSNPAPYHYSAYGLHLASAIQLPELSPASDSMEPAALITLGEVPEFLEGSEFSGFKFMARPGQLLIKTDTIARILVCSGTNIQVHRLPGASDLSIRLLTLGWALGALLQQRGLLLLHGCTIHTGSGCDVICAPTGVGKSSMTAAMIRRGYAFLDDDLGAVRWQGSQPFVQPGCAEIKLHQPALEDWPCHPPVSLQVHPEVEKFSLDAARYHHRSELPLKRVIILQRCGVSKPKLTPVQGQSTIETLLKNIYAPQFLRGMDLMRATVRQLFDLNQQTKNFLLEIPADEYHFDSLVHFLEGEFNWKPTLAPIQ